MKYAILCIESFWGVPMGIYLNPDNTDFQEAINSKIYIDKTELIAHTNSVIRTIQKNICVSARVGSENLWLRIC